MNFEKLYLENNLNEISYLHSDLSGITAQADLFPLSRA